MSKSGEALFNYRLLTWARKKSGYDIATLAKKTNVREPQLTEWEGGTSRPTIKQLRNLGRIIRRPLAFFYLPEVPRDFQPIKDFRRLPNTPTLPQSPELTLEIRKAYERREIALDLHQLLNTQPRVFDLRTNLSADPERIGRLLRQELGITFQEQSQWKVPHRAFNNWRRALEDRGILVFQTSDVALSEIRGFSIAEIPLPAVVVNMKERSPRARIFTLIHELCHVMLRTPGVCNLNERVGRIEVFCNMVAGATIIPKEEFLTETNRGHQRGAGWTEEEIERLSTQFGASKEAVVRRLTVCGLASEDFYQRKRKQYREEYERWEEEQQERQSEGFAPPYLVAFGAAGPLFTRLVLEGYDHERITASDVAGYLELRLKHLPRVRGLLTHLHPPPSNG